MAAAAPAVSTRTWKTFLGSRLERAEGKGKSKGKGEGKNVVKVVDLKHRGGGGICQGSGVAASLSLQDEHVHARVGRRAVLERPLALLDAAPISNKSFSGLHSDASLASTYSLSSDTLRMECEWALVISDPLPAIVTDMLKDRTGQLKPGLGWKPALQTGKVVVKQGISARQRRMQARRERIAKREIPEDPELLSISSSSSRERVPRRSSEGSHDAVSAYLSQIGKVKLLTREEEVLLSQRLRSTRKLTIVKERLQEELGREPNNAEWAKSLDMEVTELLRRLREGRQAKDKLVLANLRLVVSVAKHYCKNGMELADLIQAGTVGLQRGVEKFDPSRGYKMSTYAHWWIRQAINRALAVHSRTVRVPMHAHETWTRIRTATASLLIAGEEPSLKKLVEVLGLPEKKIKNALRVQKIMRSFEDNIRNSRSPDEDGTSLHHFIGDSSREASSWRIADAEHLKGEMRRLIQDTLDPREREIVRSHFGIGRTDGLSTSMETISQKLGVSRERARQLEAVALRRLRRKCLESELNRYLVDE